MVLNKKRLTQWTSLSVLFTLYLLYKIAQRLHGQFRQQRIRLLTPWRTPIILIPGLGGSRLYNAHGTQKWCSWHGFFPRVTNTWRDELTVQYNPVTKDFEDQTYITAYRTSHWRNDKFHPTPDFGGTEGVGNVLSRSVSSSWQFQGVLDLCEQLGYTKWASGVQNANVYGAPYDFRKITSPRIWLSYCKSLQALIEMASSPVVLLSHSMGSPLLLTFFVQYLEKVVPCATTWKQRHIKRWVTVNGAFGGAGKAVRSVLSGDNNGMGYICDNGCHDWYQPLLENTAGVLWMLPHHTLFSPTVPLVTIGDKEYTVKDLGKLLAERVSPSAAAAYNDTVLPLLTLKAPHVPVVSLTSTVKGTKLQTEYLDDRLHFEQVHMVDERVYYSQYLSNVEHMCGDGTVPYLSLTVPQRWMEEQQEPVTFVKLQDEDMGHTSILFHKNSLKTLASLIE